jgi:hypothetical protein
LRDLFPNVTGFIESIPVEILEEFNLNPGAYGEKW